MAKEKRSAADLDAELAALEAELAALEGKAKKPKEKPTPTKAKPEAEAPSTPPPAAAPAKEEGKGRFSMPKFGKREKPAQALPPEPRSDVRPPSPASAATPGPGQGQGQGLGTYDASVWRQDGDAWVRVVPETKVPVVRRVLDENGDVVREEPADARAVDEVSSVKAERGLGRLLRRK